MYGLPKRWRVAVSADTGLYCRTLRCLHNPYMGCRITSTKERYPLGLVNVGERRSLRTWVSTIELSDVYITHTWAVGLPQLKSDTPWVL
ncbi:hypothetical protein GDO78_011351 [Eleutherodactylus coqui]|uniref:Uncharacterized protein n=1 Tax=Eleutherodactylus coqui TaxID=57060 RepID=A0A8J6KBH9_ELECQ|nr:hypothetical protein GDO78_011351 [Eleutherodactylus coqui]